jgi:hypothetical protein
MQTSHEDVVLSTAGTGVRQAERAGAAPLYPIIEPVRPASEMAFTPEQLAWLVDVARPRCCHVTGEHDPTHFAAGRYVCSFQLAEVAWRLLAALGLEAEPADRGHHCQRRVDPAMAIPRTGCHQCARADR